MRTALKCALLFGVVTFASQPCPAQSAPETGGPLQGLVRNTERGAERLQRDFDLNRDGRVTHDEMNRLLGAQFAGATRHAPSMTMEQFMLLRANQFRQRNEQTFRSLDWNGDGKLSPAEFAAPQRIRFVSMDRAGAGYISCAAQYQTGGRAGLSRFCTDNDLNLDGRVTRQELDTAIATRFAKVVGKAQAMTMAQFVQSEEQRFEIANARIFRRLDADGNGALTIQEFAASELELFARLDKNKDGVLAPAELHARVTKVSRND